MPRTSSDPDPRLGPMGLGASQLGNLGRQMTDETADAVVDRAWELGVRLFDTAPHYGLGLSERRLGRALARRPRAEFLLSTKVGRLLEPREAAGERDDEGFDVPATARRRWDFSRDGVLRSVEASLERLGLDRVDILYLHDPDDPDHFEVASTEGVQALIELREQGVVGAVGAGMNASAPLTELIRRADVDLVMCAGRFTLLDDTAAHDLLPLALERGVGVVAAGVYNSGILSAPEVPAAARFDYQEAPAELIERARRLARIAREHGVDLPTIAVAYVLRHPAVVTAVLGARTPEHVTQSVERSAATVPPALWDRLAAEGLIPEMIQ